MFIWGTSSREPQRRSLRPTIDSAKRRLCGPVIKIGAVARHFGVSPDLLRMYEREGLLLPVKSQYGTRFYTAADLPWIGQLLRLVREARLTLSQIRRVLAGIPCDEGLQCGERKQACDEERDRAWPCWRDSTPCGTTADDCYACSVYRAAPQLPAWKMLLSE